MSATDKRPGRFEKTNELLSTWFERVAMIGAVGMIVFTMVDVVGAKLFNHPFAAGTEAVYLLQLIAIAGALAMSKLDGRHVRIELIDRVPQPALGVIHTVAAVLGLGIFVALTWTSFDYAVSLYSNNEITATSLIPLYPFAIWMGLSCIPMVLIMVRDLIISAREIVRK